MSGTPPPTAASKRICAPRSPASRSSSGPCAASSILLAVTTDAPCSSARRTIAYACSTPPITSTTTSGRAASASSTLSRPGHRVGHPVDALARDVAIEDVRQLNALGQLRADRRESGRPRRRPCRTRRARPAAGGAARRRYVLRYRSWSFAVPVMDSRLVCQLNAVIVALRLALVSVLAQGRPSPSQVPSPER